MKKQRVTKKRVSKRSRRTLTPSEPMKAVPAVPPPLDIALSPKQIEKHFEKVVGELIQHITVRPKGIELAALVGDPGAEIPGTEPEPVYTAAQRDDIQGNIIPGFNKDHQHFLFLQLGKIANAKRWLHWIAPRIASMEECLTFVRSHRRLRLRLGIAEPRLHATWINIGFSRDAIAKLVDERTADAFGDESFRQGLAARSTYLGDPSDPRQAGHRSKWVVGGDRNAADILVIIAADDPGHLRRMVDEVKSSATGDGLRVIFEQGGATLPPPLRGHEHFGFKDGVSQPGVRGKVSTAPGDFITPRYLDASVDRERARLFAKPGQLLLWPGQFLLGEPRQHPEDFFRSAPPATNFPRWAKLGSYLVCRRLRQDVGAFWDHAIAAATAVGMTPTRFASMLVGRWPSGAPLARSPAADDLALAGDPWANNHFLFNDPTRPAALRPIPGYTGDGFSQAQADFLGTVCPHFAHIRKSNPRDIATDLGKPADSMLRMILRRGIPFGPAIINTKRVPPGLRKKERGLMFICYGSTIEEQFELLSRRWTNSPLQPNIGGHDPIIGQADVHGARTRYIDVPTSTGSRRLTIRDEWVIPTGGGYFFAPPISAIAGVLGA